MKKVIIPIMTILVLIITLVILTNMYINKGTLSASDNGPLTVNTYRATIYTNETIEYDVFTPANITPNTKVIIYSTEPDSYASILKPAIIDSKLESIVVVYKLTWIGADPMKALVTEIINNLKSLYNLSSNYYIADGFSQKGHTAIKGMVDYLTANPTNERQLILLNDGYPLQDVDGTATDLLTPSDISVLEQNNTFIVDFCQKDYINNNGYTSQYWRSLGSRLLNSNLDILFVSPDTLPSTEFWTNHAYIYHYPYTSGFYDKLLAFIYDGGSLPETGYIYRLYDKATGQITEYSAAEIKSRLNSTLNTFNNMSSYSQGNVQEETTALAQVTTTSEKTTTTTTQEITITPEETTTTTQEVTTTNSTTTTTTQKTILDNTTTTENHYEETTTVDEYTIVFYMNDDTNNKYYIDTVTQNSRVSMPPDPKREGYVFNGWITSSGNLYNFSSNITADLDLYADWSIIDSTTNPTTSKIINNPTQPESDPDNPYTGTTSSFIITLIAICSLVVAIMYYKKNYNN